MRIPLIRRLYCGWLVTMASVSMSLGDVLSNVPEAADYQLIYQLDLPPNGGFRDATPVPYSIANTNGLLPFDRIAYYLELVTTSGVTNWVYTSMDAFTTNAAEIGLPHNVYNPVSFQRLVSNLTIFANVVGVKTGAFDGGNIEMWSANYVPANTLSVFGADSTNYDWGDSVVADANPGYGSFQVHNHEALQVVFAYNGWANAVANGGTNNDDVGIGNQPTGYPDWTYAANAANYQARTLLMMVRPKRFLVAFTALPRNHQITPRNRTDNTSVVPIRGKESLGGFDQAVLRVFRNGVQQGADVGQALVYTNGSALFSFNPQIVAELASYSFEIYLGQRTNLYLVQRVSDVVAGDIFLVYGQSNAQAADYTHSGSANGYASPWIRTFGESSDSPAGTTNYLFWVQANGDGSLGVPAGVGQWPLVIARKIVDNYHIPLAIINGARAGFSMPQLQSDNLDPNNLLDTPPITRPYNRLRYRAVKAGVASSVRAILYYQGENDYDDVIQHTNGFAGLYRSWKLDYPVVERIFVTQVHVGCDVTRETPELRDAQRRFPDVYPDVRVMSANALPGHDGCHYTFKGYERHGLNSFAQVARELYGAPDSPDIDPPNPLLVEFADSTGDRLRIIWRRSGDTIGIDPKALVDFRIGGDSANLISGSVSTNSLELQYDRPVTSATNLAYLAHIGSGRGWVTNANGVGLLTFSEPIANPFLRVEFISPGGTTNVSPGVNLLLSAQATAGTDVVTRMELLVDGSTYAIATNTNVISAAWAVPATYAHYITAAAFNSKGDQADRSLRVFADLPFTPGGVSNGLSLWLRPESGIERDALGRIGRWRDSSGNSNDCVLVRSYWNSPSYVEGLFGDLPGVVFSGHERLGSTNGMPIGSYTKVARFQLHGWNLNNLLSPGPTTNAAHALLVPHVGPMLWQNTPFVTGSYGVDLFQPYVLTATYDALTQQGILYLDGLQVGNGKASANNLEPFLQLGAYQNSNYLVGAIGEAMIYNRVLTTAERTNVENYLFSKPQFPLTNLRPVIRSIARTNNLVTITWSAVPGQKYRVQFQSSLNGTNWSDLSQNTTASAPSAAQSDTNGSVLLRFYRVIHAP